MMLQNCRYTCTYLVLSLLELSDASPGNCGGRPCPGPLLSPRPRGRWEPADKAEERPEPGSNVEYSERVLGVLRLWELASIYFPAKKFLSGNRRHLAPFTDRGQSGERIIFDGGDVCFEPMEVMCKRVIISQIFILIFIYINIDVKKILLVLTERQINTEKQCQAVMFPLQGSWQGKNNHISFNATSGCK